VGIARIVVALVLVNATVALTGCSHKLVAHGGESTISVFDSKEDFDKLMSMKSKGGASGLVGGLGESLMAKRVPENSHIKILSSDAEGDEIQVVDGPNAGLRGYVARDNVN